MTDETAGSGAEDAASWGALNDVGFVLRLAQIAVFKDFIRVLEPHGLRPAHYAALSLIEGRPGLDQHRLGLLLNVQKSNLVALVDELCRQGLVARERQGRSYALSLSAAGREAFAALNAVAGAHERRVIEALGGDSERDALLERLRRLGNGL